MSLTRVRVVKKHFQEEEIRLGKGPKSCSPSSEDQPSCNQKKMISGLVLYYILIILLLIFCVSYVDSCSCQFPKNLASTFCQSKYAVIVTFEKNTFFDDPDIGNRTALSSNSVRVSVVKPEGRRVRLLKRQLEREASAVRVGDASGSSPVSSSSSTPQFKALKVKEIREIIQMTTESKKGLSNKILWVRRSRSTCNPMDRIKQNGSTAYLVFGDTTSDGRLLLESCKMMQWDFMTEEERSLVRSFVRNGLPCR
jgi:hypothetical protein